MDTPDDIDVNKLVGYALRLNSSAVIGRLGYLLEVLEIGDKRDLELLRRQLGRAYVPLDPLLPPEGKFLARWRLRLNITAKEINSLLQT